MAMPKTVSQYLAAGHNRLDGLLRRAAAVQGAAVHNALEEEEGGVYRLLDHLPGAKMEALVEKLNATPAVPAAAYNARPGVLDATRRALARAGYELLA